MQKETQDVFFRTQSMAYDLAYYDFKDLSRRTASEKLLRNKVFDNLI